MCMFSFFFEAAKEVRVFIGSEPGLSTKISGVAQLESENTSLRSNRGGLMKYSPRFSTTNRVREGTSLSGLITRIMMRRFRPALNFYVSLGMLNSSGATASYSYLYMAMCSLKWVMKPLKPGRSAARCISLHIFMLTHSAGGCSSGSPSATPPVSRNLNSFWSRLGMRREHSKNEKISLSFSNSDRQMFLYRDSVNSLFRLAMR